MKLSKHANWYLPTYLSETPNNHNFIHSLCRETSRRPRTFLHTSLQLSQFHEVIISIFHGVSIHCEQLRRSMHFSEIQMVVENYGWCLIILEALCLLLLFVGFTFTIIMYFVLHLKLQKTFILQLLCF